MLVIGSGSLKLFSLLVPPIVRLGEVDEARKVRVAKEEAAKAVSAQKLLVAQQEKLGAMMNNKGKFVDLRQGERLSHHHLSVMSPVHKRRAGEARSVRTGESWWRT